MARRPPQDLRASKVQRVSHRPYGLAGLQPIYQAVPHGCRAGLHEEVCAEVYADRILRGTGDDGFYSTRKLGLIGADLGAVACFFDEPWQRPSPALSEPSQAWLLNEASFRLRALGRLGEALAPMRVGAEMRVKQEIWKSAAIIYGNLSELELTLGDVAAAVSDAEQAVDFADRSKDAFQQMGNRTALADAWSKHGEGETALLSSGRPRSCKPSGSPNIPCFTRCRASGITTSCWPRRSAPRGGGF